MEHVMFIQRLRRDKIEEYKEAHKNVWNDLLKAIKECGIEREMIWLYDNITFAYMMAENFNDAMGKLAKTEIFKKWIKTMEPLMEAMPEYGGEEIAQLEKVFDFEKQLSESNKE